MENALLEHITSEDEGVGKLSDSGTSQPRPNTLKDSYIVGGKSVPLSELQKTHSDGEILQKFDSRAPNQDKAQVLYDAVSKKYNLGTFDEFKEKMQSPEKQKAFYDGVGAKYNLGSFNEFKTKIGGSQPKPEDAGAKLSANIPDIKDAHSFYDQFRRDKDQARTSQPEKTQEGETNKITSTLPKEQPYLDRLSKNPRDTKAANDLGALYLSEGKVNEANNTFLNAINNNKHDAAARVGYAHVANLQGDYQTALGNSNVAIQITPQNSLAYANRAYAKSKLGDTEGALKDADKGEALDPDNHYFNSLKASIHAKNGNQSLAQGESLKADQKIDNSNNQLDNGVQKFAQGDKNVPFGLPDNATIDQNSTPQEKEYNENVRSQIKFVDWLESGGVKGSDDYASKVLGYFINPIGATAASGEEQVGKGLDDIKNADGTLKVLGGLLNVGFGATMSGTPEGISYNATLGNAPEPIQNALMRPLETMFHPTSETGKGIAQLGDVLAQVLTVGAAMKGSKGLLDIANKKLKGEELSSQDAQEFRQGIKNITPEDIKNTQAVISSLPEYATADQTKKVVSMAADMMQAKKAVETANPLMKPILEQAADKKEEDVKAEIENINKKPDEVKPNTPINEQGSETEPSDKAVVEPKEEKIEPSTPSTVLNEGESKIQSNGKNDDAQEKGQKEDEKVISSTPESPANAIVEAGDKGESMETAKKIADEYNYDHPSQMLASIKKNVGETFETVQDAVKSDNAKVKEFLFNKKFEKESESTYHDLLDNHDYSPEEFNTKYDEAIKGLAEKYGVSDDVGQKLSKKLSEPKAESDKSEEPQKEDNFFASIKQRHLKEDWVNEIKSKIPKGSEPREREVFNKVSDDFKHNKITDKQIEDTQDRLINNKKSDLRDTAIVLAEKVRLKSLENSIRDGISDAEKSGDTYGREALQADLSTVEAKQFKNTQAAVMAGRERFAFTGRLLQSEAEEDFSISKIKHELQEANIGKKNISDVMREADDLKNKLDDSERKLRDLQKQKPKRVYSTKETSEIDAWNKKAKQAIDKLLDFGKANLPEGTKVADIGSEAVRKALHVAVDGVTEAIKAGKALFEALKEQLEKFKDSDFYKGLSDADKKEHEEKFNNVLSEAFNSTSKSAELKSAYEQTLEKTIAKNEQKISDLKDGKGRVFKGEKDFSPKERVLRSINDKLKKELSDLRKKDNVRTFELRRRAKESGILNANKKLKQQLEDIEKTGDYKIPEKPNTPIGKAVEAVKLDNENIKDQIRNLKAKVDFKNMNASERGLYYAKKILRFSILSGAKSLGKIGELALARPLTSVPDAMMAETFGKVFKSLSEESPTHNPIGYKEALKSEYGGFVKGYDKYVGNIVSILKTGNGDVDLRYGSNSKQSILHNKVLDFWQGFHKILKEPTRKSGVYKGAIRATKFAQEHGMDLTDPDTQVFIASVAKEFGDRQILMTDNLFTDILTNLQHKTEDFNKVAGAVLYSKKPVTKVPVNFVGESLERVFGLPRAAGKSLLNITIPATVSYAKGLTGKGEGITFGEAVNRTVKKLGETKQGQKKVDSIIRNFSYGGTTLLYFGLGYTFHKEIKDLLNMLPKYLQHIPQLAPLNIGASTGEMHEANKEFTKSLGQATTQESKDLIKTTPLVSSMLYESPKAARTLLTKEGDKNGMQKTMDFLSDESGQEVSEYNPQIIQQIAKWLNKGDIKPHGFYEQVGQGVPVVRGNIISKKQEEKSKAANEQEGVEQQGGEEDENPKQSRIQKMRKKK